MVAVRSFEPHVSVVAEYSRQEYLFEISQEYMTWSGKCSTVVTVIVLFNAVVCEIGGGHPEAGQGNRDLLASC